MIARLRHGRTPASRADEHLALMRGGGLPAYRSVQGNRRAYLRCRSEAGVARFLTLRFWDWAAAIAAFAGADVTRATVAHDDVWSD